VLHSVFSVSPSDEYRHMYDEHCLTVTVTASCGTTLRLSQFRNERSGFTPRLQALPSLLILPRVQCCGHELDGSYSRVLPFPTLHEEQLQCTSPRHTHADTPHKKVASISDYFVCSCVSRFSEWAAAAVRTRHCPAECSCACDHGEA